MTNHYLRNKFSCASDEHKMHYYFNRRPSNWNINDFLNECNLKTTRAKLGLYIKCLETIAGGNNEDSQKKKLLNKYRECDKTDRKLAKNWELDRKSEKIPPIKIHNTFSGDTQTIGTVNDRIFIVGSSKRVDHEKDDEEPIKQTKRKVIYCLVGDEEEDVPAPEESLNSVLSGPKNWILPSGENVSDIVARKLSANAKATKKKKRIFTSEKATLREKNQCPFLQVAGTSGQLLVEDLVEGFYVVFPGPTFEFPTRLQHIESLKSAVNIIKFVMDKYNQTNKIVENKVSTHNVFDDIFSKNNDLDMDKPAHCKSKPK
ncbi:unnamed protein product [Rhizophagus irregularis]|nr:unnamed protein product [Rhizophagus irregularis]